MYIPQFILGILFTLSAEGLIFYLLVLLSQTQKGGNDGEVEKSD